MSKFKVAKMSCGHCTAAIENSIIALDPQAEVLCDLNERTVYVIGDADTQALLGAFAEAGYDAVQIADK